LFILIAPPALIFSAYYSLNGGQLDAFAHGLFFAGLFFTILVLLLPRLFLGLPFAVSWWAYTFPLDAMTGAALALPREGRWSRSPRPARPSGRTDMQPPRPCSHPCG
jgi:tellurite resistance protein TehA-like permease